MEKIKEYQLKSINKDWTDINRIKMERMNNVVLDQQSNIGKMLSGTTSTILFFYDNRYRRAKEINAIRDDFLVPMLNSHSLEWNVAYEIGYGRDFERNPFFWEVDVTNHDDLDLDGIRRLIFPKFIFVEPRLIIPKKMVMT